MYMIELDNDAGVTKEAVKEVAKDIYIDGGRPVVKPTGELIGLLPRTIKAALLPLEKWILEREYNLDETKKLLAEKLKNVPLDQIQPPEAYIAVPALQYISYCMNNKELRDMYANLLANSMNKVIKNGVHPGFVEIIKQLCPDEAKILRYIYVHTVVPTITVRYENEKNEEIDVIKNFSDVGERTQCEYPFEINKYFDNLIRLGLLETLPDRRLTNEKVYENLKHHPYILKRTGKSVLAQFGYSKANLKEGYMCLTDYGKSFCNICINTDETVIMTVNP